MITAFRGLYRFLSNFYPCFVMLDGLTYTTVEHAYQAAKTLDENERRIIWLSPTPGQAKRAGQTIVLRPDWEEVKFQVMEDLLRQKFSKEPYRGLLLSTGDKVLIEGNEWGDKVWGMVWTGEGWQGENHLGKLLMKIRKELQSGTNTR